MIDLNKPFGVRKIGYVLWLVGLSLLLTHCESGASSDEDVTARPPDVHPKTRDTAADPVYESAYEYARRINGLIDRDPVISDSETTKRLPAASLDAADIQWVKSTQDALRNSPPSATTQPAAQATALEPAVNPAPVATTQPQTTSPETGSETSEAADPPPAIVEDLPKREVKPMSTPSLFAELTERVRASDQPAVERALAISALSVATPSQVLNDQDLADLTPTQQASIRRYHQLMVMLDQQMRGGDEVIGKDTLVRQIDQIFGVEPIQIGRVVLCKRVKGFGVYEAFGHHSFLAGREQPVVVYVEVDHFQTKRTSSDQYQVQLAQEVVLYHEADGLAVWKHPWVDITDESRNRRRDFFVVQMVRLPANLGVGKYQLKVRVKDVNGQSIDEATLPIHIVGDRGLIREVRD